MFDNPFLILLGLVMCWPGILPMIIVFYIARSFDFNVTRRHGSTAVQADDMEGI